MDIHIVLYRAVEMECIQWALHVHDHSAETHEIFEVRNGRRDFQRDSDPTTDLGLEQMIHLGSVGKEKCEEVMDVLGGVEQPQEWKFYESWDRQQHVLDMVDALEKQEILGYRPGYKNIRRQLDQVSADIKKTRDAVDRNDYQRFSIGKSLVFVREVESPDGQ